MAITQPKRLTREEFYSLPEDARYELVNGELEALSPPDIPHGFTQAHLPLRLVPLLEERLGGLVMAEVDVPISETRIRRPDVVYLAPSHLDRIAGDRLAGPPDLVVEIVSADDPKRDYRDKVVDYAEAGVDHYWIVDPHQGRVRVMERVGDRYPSHRDYGMDDLIESPLLGGHELRPRESIRR